MDNEMIEERWRLVTPASEEKVVVTKVVDDTGVRDFRVFRRLGCLWLRLTPKPD